MSEQPVYVYRGFHAQHPELDRARKGEIHPAKRDSGVTPETHNRGGWEAQSPYTSWTYELSVARKYAMDKGSGGAVLRLQKYDPLPEDDWSWEESPNNFFEIDEFEVLLRGVRMDAEVVLDE